jgi:hypothetical protein
MVAMGFVGGRTEGEYSVSRFLHLIILLGAL